MSTTRVDRFGRVVALTAEEQAAHDANVAAHAAGALDRARVAAAGATKAEAARRINLLSGGPALESRLLRWAAQVNHLRATTHPYPDALPSPWAAREAAMVSQGTAIEAAAAASNTIETDIASLANVAAVMSWIAAMPTDERWPS